ncbi:MAG TPA: glycosyltransferase family 4 protein [candidate division WWE3 bacterium]|uniref:Glycosyltransferase family 4 protein n=1 Tax=candidate division WWE3 bacterium TaxID=2053526 RepID=A0A7C1SNK2_UNCKA|nr:glycosyltransferase family 4 protein [candidate division WWE3 bacterium]
MKVALVHDFLNQYGGAERVLEAIHEIYPYSHVYTSLYDPKKLPLRMKNWDIRPFKLPKVSLTHFLKYYTAFYPLLWEQVNLSGYDLVISSSSNFVKGVLTPSETLHISYIHTPPRFLYHYERETARRDLFIYKPVLALLDNYFRIWDYNSAQRPDFLVANSKEVAGRIKKFYSREAAVIYPPVNLPKESKVAEKVDEKKYYLVVSRLGAYKRIDLAIKAANKLKIPLKIVGTGKEEERLKRMAESTVEFLGFVSDSKLANIYSNCEALVFPTDEDFGIVPVEAMFFGKPVLALAKGGALETVVAGKTGEFFQDGTVDSLAEVWEKFEPSKYKASDCRTQAKKFSKERFKKEFSEFVNSKLE